MLGVTYTDLRRGTVLVHAFQTGEITVREFIDGAERLQPEAAQVLATVLAQNDCPRSELAHSVCSKAAARSRPLS